MKNNQSTLVTVKIGLLSVHFVAGKSSYIFWNTCNRKMSNSLPKDKKVSFIHVLVTERCKSFKACRGNSKITRLRLWTSRFTQKAGETQHFKSGHLFSTWAHPYLALTSRYNKELKLEVLKMAFISICILCGVHA